MFRQIYMVYAVFYESLLELFEQAWYMLRTFYNNRKKSR